MRIICGTILAAAMAALSAQGAGDSLAESPVGVGNIPANGVLTNGALIISFDDRNLADWERAIPLFDKYDAHATFFFTGRCEGDAARVLKKLSEHGHSIGLHGLKHLNADVAVAEKGGAAYWAGEISPQLDGCRSAGIEAYHTDIEDILKCIRLCAERNEAFVLASHGIHHDAKHIHMKTEWLERILATASECGVQCLGFDELK